MTQKKCDISHTKSHDIIQFSWVHGYGIIVHKPARIYISRQIQYSEDSNEFSLSNADKEQLA